MKPSRKERLFELALEQTPEKRNEFLTAACADDDALRQAIESMLTEHGQLKSAQSKEKPDQATLDFPDEGPVVETIGMTIGRYKLLEKIGEGGNGVVYAAEQRRPVKRRVAFKIIKLGMDTKQVIARFEAERQALALMDHPNIAKVLDAGATETGRPYFVMELVRGLSLTDYCDQAKLSTQDRLDLFIKICHAIQHAHQKGVIHRDIKPSNILVTLHDGVPVPKVIDFGIAKATQQELTEKTVYTQFRQFIGTPAYMSPEQAEMSGLDIDTRSDIYSLGVLLYELLTGATPFDSEELMQSGLDEMRKMIREREPHRPSTKIITLSDEDKTSTAQRQSTETPKLISTLRGDLDWIVMKCLEKDRSRRYDTADGLAHDLQHHLDHRPVSARPPSTLYRLQKAWRRNRLLYTSAAAIIGTVILALVVSSGSFLRERKARINEQAQRQEAESQRAIATENAQEAARQRESALKNQASAEANARQARLNLYAADMNLAHAAIRANNYGRAATLLARHVPAAGEEDLRHWEWRYLWQQVQGDELYALPMFDHHVFNVDHSPDGRHLAIALFDGRILIWDLAKHKQHMSLTTASGTVGKCLYSPDGKTLLGIPRVAPGIIRWSTETYEEGAALRFPGTSKGGNARDLAFCPDNNLVGAYAGWHDEDTEKWITRVIVWKVSSGEVLWTQPAGGYSAHTGTVCFSSDGSRLYVGESTGSIRVYDSSSGVLTSEWAAHPGLGITALCASPDGKNLATGSGYSSGDIKIWDAGTGGHVTTLSGHTGWVSWLEFSGDSQTLYSASADQTARIWNLGDFSTRFVLRGHRDELYCLSLSPDGSRLITGCKDGSTLVWTTRPREREKQHLSRATVNNRYFYAPNGEHLFVYNDQGEIIELDPVSLADRDIVYEFGKPFYLLFSPDSRLVLVSKPNAGTEIYDLKSRRMLRTLDNVFAFKYFPKVNQVFSVRSDGSSAVVWDANRWEIVATLTSQTTSIQGDVSSDGKLVALERSKGMIAIARDAFTDKGLSIHKEFKAHKRSTTGLAFSPDDRLLGSCSDTGFAYLWDTTDWSRVATLRGHAQGIHGISFSTDSRRVLTSSGGNDTLKLWDSTSHQEVMTLSADASLVRSPKLVASGRSIAAVGSNKNQYFLHVWHAPSWDQIETAEANRRQCMNP